MPDELNLLGRSEHKLPRSPDEAKIETFPNRTPGRNYRITLSAPYQQLRPVAPGFTGVPDCRSFLDPGKVVPVGSESLYVWSSHNANRAPDFAGNRSRYGNETLPSRFDIPQQPLFNF